MTDDTGLTLCRLERLTSTGWQVAHHGIDLLHPARYVERLADNGVTARVILLDTGEVITHGDAIMCGICGQGHSDGSCLL